MAFTKHLVWLSLFLGVPGFAAESEENLPPLLETIPTQAHEVLTPVGAGKKDIPAARQQLQREAAKAQAEAVVGVRCTPGGVGREGLTWYQKDAYCRGLAIRYLTK